MVLLLVLLYFCTSEKSEKSEKGSCRFADGEIQLELNGLLQPQQTFRIPCVLVAYISRNNS